MCGIIGMAALRRPPIGGPDVRSVCRETQYSRTRHGARGYVRRFVAAGSWPGTFKSMLSSLPSSPAASPAALAATGGLGGMAPKLATAGEAKSGHAGPGMRQRRRKWPLWALPARGAWGGMLYLKYRLVPCSSRAAGVVSRYSGLVTRRDCLSRPCSCDLLLASVVREGRSMSSD